MSEYKIEVGTKIKIESLPNDVFEFISINPFIIKSEKYGCEHTCLTEGLQACIRLKMWNIIS